MRLFSSPKKTLSIDFSSSEIKFVEGKFSKKAVNISNSFSLLIPSSIYFDGKIEDMDQMVYLIKAALDENKTTANLVNAVINSTEIINREIVIPAMEKSQIDSMISYQIEDYLPINQDDYIVKYIILGSFIDEGVEKLNLMLIGVPKYMVESHLNLIKNLGLKPNVLEYQGNSISKFIGFNDFINDNMQIMDNTFASIDFAYEHTKLTIVKDGVIRVARILELGQNHIVEKIMNKKDLNQEETMLFLDELSSIEDYEAEVIDIAQDLFERIEMVFRYYKTRDLSNDINEVILQGQLINIPGVDKVFSNYFNTPVMKINSLNKVKFDGNFSQYANAIGGLIRIDEV